MKAFWRSALRLAFLQASWNREAMQSMGLVCAALPAVRARGMSASQWSRWSRRRLGFVNTNPYLAGILLGATLRTEEQEGEEAALRLEKGLSRHLGAVGDGLFWRGLRPLFAYGGLAGALFGGPRGVLIAWLAFAFLATWSRGWGLRIGYSRGLQIVDWLDLQGFPRRVQWAQKAAQVALGAALSTALLSRQSQFGDSTALACAAGALLCGALAARRRWPPEWVLPAFALICWAISRWGTGS